MGSTSTSLQVKPGEWITYLSKRETAKRLDISRHAVERLIADGALSVVELSDGTHGIDERAVNARLNTNGKHATVAQRLSDHDIVHVLADIDLDKLLERQARELAAASITSRKTTIVGALIAQLRSARGLMQRELAAATNISRVGIIRIETGESLPRAETLDVLAHALAVEPAILYVAAGYLPPWLVELMTEQPLDYDARDVSDTLRDAFGVEA